MTEKRPCKFCGHSIIMGARNTQTGAPIPLTPVSAVYVLDADDAVKASTTPPAGQLVVSHWETCPKVKQAAAARDKARKAKAAAR